MKVTRPHVEGQENVHANDSLVADVELLAATEWLENYLQQRDVTKTGDVSVRLSVCRDCWQKIAVLDVSPKFCLLSYRYLAIIF